MKVRLLALLSTLAALVPARGYDIFASGDWVETINVLDLASGAGSGLLIPESLSGATTFSIAIFNLGWKLKARIGSASWNGNMKIWVRRSSNGGGLGTISGGNSYVQLGGTDVEICTGFLGRNNVALQYKVTGLSPNVPPGNYTAPIIYTVALP